MRTVRDIAMTAAFATTASGLMACAAPPRSPPPLTPGFANSQQVQLPDVLGTPVVVVVPEFPVAALVEGERASFEIEFAIDLRGAVTESKLRASSHPALAEHVLERHRTWVYAVATRDKPCRTTKFYGVQRIDVERRGGKLTSELEPAKVLETKNRRDYPTANGTSTLSVPNYRNILAGMPYPPAAQRARIEGDLAVLIEFAADGTVKDAFPVNAVYDKWGFTQAALKRVMGLRIEPAPGRPTLGCLPLSFRLR